MSRSRGSERTAGPMSSYCSSCRTIAAGIVRVAPTTVCTDPAGRLVAENDAQL